MRVVKSDVSASQISFFQFRSLLVRGLLLSEPYEDSPPLVALG
jgi:hypothetical protein